MENDVVHGFKTTLRELMSDSGLTVKGLGRAIDVNMFVVRKWLHNVKDVKVKSLIKVANHFGCSIEYLCGKSDIFLEYEPQPLPPFGEWLKTILQANAGSSYKLLKEAKISSSQYNSWLHGTMPMLTTLERLSECLNITLDSLIGRDRSDR